VWLAMLFYLDCKSQPKPTATADKQEERSTKHKKSVLRFLRDLFFGGSCDADNEPTDLYGNLPWNL
jgi:hypothetical protein